MLGHTKLILKPIIDPDIDIGVALIFPSIKKEGTLITNGDPIIRL